MRYKVQGVFIGHYNSRKYAKYFIVTVLAIYLKRYGAFTQALEYTTTGCTKNSIIYIISGYHLHY